MDNWNSRVTVKEEHAIILLELKIDQKGLRIIDNTRGFRKLRCISLIPSREEQPGFDDLADKYTQKKS